MAKDAPISTHKDRPMTPKDKGLSPFKVADKHDGTIQVIAALRQERDELAAEVERWKRDAEVRLLMVDGRVYDARDFRRLQAIVDKLPKTADGVPVVPFVDTVYAKNGLPTMLTSTYQGIADNYYSTREAAEAAGEGEKA